jgi:hypothetical protein
MRGPKEKEVYALYVLAMGPKSMGKLFSHRDRFVDARNV